MTQGLLLTAETTNSIFSMGAAATLFGSLLIGLLTFLAKHQFNNFEKTLTNNAQAIEIMKTENKKCNDDLEEKILELVNKNDEKVQKNINKLEDEISGIKKEYGNIKGDFATVFLQRDDFFRFTNGMENSLKDQNGKIDRLLFMMSEQKKN